MRWQQKQESQKAKKASKLVWKGSGLTKAGCIRSLLVASRLQVRRDIREYAAANKASVASTCPWARYNFAYFFLGHGPLFSVFQVKVIKKWVKNEQNQKKIRGSAIASGFWKEGKEGRKERHT